LMGNYLSKTWEKKEKRSIKVKATAGGYPLSPTVKRLPPKREKKKTRIKKRIVALWGERGGRSDPWGLITKKRRWEDSPQVQTQEVFRREGKLPQGHGPKWGQEDGSYHEGGIKSTQNKNTPSRNLQTKGPSVSKVERGEKGERPWSLEEKD